MKLIMNKKDLKEFLNMERSQYGISKRWIPYLCITEQQYLWKHNYLLRKTEYHINTGHKVRGLLFKIMLNRFQNNHQLHIPTNIFDKGLRVMHLGPVLVNSKVKAGKGIALHINTSVVAAGVSNKAPVLDDGVVVGVGAVILGDVYIAKNVAIGANSVVTKSFEEENIALAGAPAKKVSNNGRLNWNKGA